MAVADPLIFDVMWADVAKPDVRDPSPSIMIPLGGAWIPGDYRVVVFTGPLTSSTTYTPNGSTYSYMPLPSGWSSLSNNGSLGGSPSGTQGTWSIGRRLQAGDTDAEFSIAGPSASTTAMPPLGAANLTAWSLGGSVKVGIFAFTIRGVDPSYTPIGYAPANTPTQVTGPPATWTYPARTLTAGMLPGCELALAFFSYTFSGVTGWTDLWDNGFTAAHAVRPNKYAQGFALMGRRYTSGTSTGTFVVTFQDAQPGAGAEVGAEHGGNPSVAPILYWYFKQADDVTITASAAPQETDSAGGAATVTVGPETTVKATAAPMEVDTAYPGGATPLYGFMVRDPYILKATPVDSSVLSWRQVTTANNSLTVLTSIDGAKTWDVATSGQPVPRLRKGTTNVPYVLAKVIWTRNSDTDPSPRLYDWVFDIRHDSGRDELVPLITGTVKRDDIKVSSDTSANYSGSGSSGGVEGYGGGQDGGGTSITLKGEDFSRIIAKRPWEAPYFIAAATPYPDACLQLARNRRPATIRANMATSTRVTPLLVYGSQGETDPWKDDQELAIADGCEVLFDPYGTWTYRPVPDPATGISVWHFGPDHVHTIVELDRSLDDEEVYNHIIVDGEATSPTTGQEVVAVHGEWKDLDPASPSYYYGPLGPRPKHVKLSAVITPEQAAAAAEALGLQLKGYGETVEITVVPHPGLECGDIITITMVEAKASGNYLIQTMETPGRVGSGQKLTCYRMSRN